MFKRILLALVILNIVGFTIYSIVRNNRSQSGTKATLETKAVATKWERMGVMPQSDMIRLRTIRDSVSRSGAISDDDFNYLVQKIQDPCSKSTSPGYVHFSAGVPFTCIMKYAPGQKERIMQACLPLIKSKNQLDQRIGLDVAAYQRDNRAIPYALPLLQSPYEKVRVTVKKYFTAVGYRSPNT